MEEFIETSENCKECGTRRAVLRAGFVYCAECGLGTQHSQPVIDFSRDNFTGLRLVGKHNVPQKKNDTEALSNMWSTWHAHNMILLGLVDETCGCGARAGLSSTVLRLWARWLRHNRVAFFSKAQLPPKIALGFNPRDLRLLYNMKKKRRRTVPLVVTTSERDDVWGRKIQASRNKTALMKLEHEEFLTQNTQTTHLASQTLDQIKIQEEELKTIDFNTFAKKHFKKNLDEEALDLHINKGFCGPTCRCLRKVKGEVSNRKNVSSIFNLYVLLFLGLRINNDDIQLGDILRWCREGHLTFGSYNHLFPEDMHFNKQDRFKLSSAGWFSHSSILNTAHSFAKTFRLDGIKSPNLSNLIKRYTEELELPHELYELILRIVLYATEKKDSPDYRLENKEFPNYEAIALSYIIISLKMLFGLDGVSENRISASAEKVNVILNVGKDFKQFVDSKVDSKVKRLFVWKDWTKYIEYRKVCLKQCHYPTRMRLDPKDADYPELFLYHKAKTRKSPLDDSVKNHSNSITKSLLQTVEDNTSGVEKQFPYFQCSLTPMSSYVEELLNWQYIDSPYSDIQINRDILDESFSQYNVSYLTNPEKLQRTLRTYKCQLYVHKFTANSDLKVDPGLKDYLKFNRHQFKMSTKQLHKTAQIIDCGISKWNREIWGEKVTSLVHTVEFLGDDLPDRVITVCHKKLFEPKANKKNKKKIKLEFKAVDLHTCYENYWIRHYPFIRKKFIPTSFEEELDVNFPACFSWLLRECASIAEITPFDLYKELCDLEKTVIEKIASKEKSKTVVEEVKTDLKTADEGVKIKVRENIVLKRKKYFPMPSQKSASEI